MRIYSKIQIYKYKMCGHQGTSLYNKLNYNQLIKIWHMSIKIDKYQDTWNASKPQLGYPHEQQTMTRKYGLARHHTKPLIATSKGAHQTSMNTTKSTLNFSLISSTSSRRLSKLTLYKLFKHSDPRTHVNNPGPKWGLTCMLSVQGKSCKLIRVQCELRNLNLYKKLSFSEAELDGEGPYV